MTNASIYKPFERFDFANTYCWLSGKSPVREEQVIPVWLLEMAGLTGKEQIKLLDESVRSYDRLFVPVDLTVQEEFLHPFERRIADAFSKGYQGVSQLSERDLFLWIGKMMYGFLYIEMQGAIRLKQLSADGLNMSQGLMHKFGNLHTMLQGLQREVVFEDFCPWSIVVVPLQDEQTDFSFRDEINTLTFSLKFKNFGIVACLQDNGTNKSYHQDFLQSLQGMTLSGQQYEELAARFYYSAYLFNRLPQYTVMDVEEVIYIDAMPLRGSQQKSLFDPWTHKTYAQVLAEFWKPWGLTLFEIIKDPLNPLSFFQEAHLPANS